jgi:hypothetical protein
MKRFLSSSLLFFEEFIKPPVENSKGTMKPISILWESIPQKSFRLGSYLKSLNDESMAKVFKTDLGYFRGLIYNDPPNFIVFVWGGEHLHTSVSASLSKNRESLKLPNLAYQQEYKNSLEGNFGKNWCFPVVYDNKKMFSNLTQSRLITFDKEHSIQALLKINDMQWKHFLDEAWS